MVEKEVEAPEAVEEAFPEDQPIFVRRLTTEPEPVVTQEAMDYRPPGARIRRPEDATSTQTTAGEDEFPEDQPIFVRRIGMESKPRVSVISPPRRSVEPLRTLAHEREPKTAASQEEERKA